MDNYILNLNIDELDLMIQNIEAEKLCLLMIIINDKARNKILSSMSKKAQDFILKDVQKIFLFYYFEATADALENGQQSGNVLIILAAMLVAFGLAIFFFQKRDLTVGMWPWQRAKMSG